MGCFLACFGSSKDAKRRNQRRKVLPRDRIRDQRSPYSNPEQPCVTPVPVQVQEYSRPVVLSPTSEIQDLKPVEQPSISTRKKVTFDSNVKTYEPVVVDEVTEFPQEKKSEECGEKEQEALAKPSESKSSSDTGSVTSTCSYPPNSRYQNCRESDDEDEEVIGYGESDLSEDDLNDDSDIGEDYEDDDDEDIAYSRARTCAVQMVTNAEQEVESPIPSGTNANLNVRDRSVYVHPVLNPVENLTQWKALKSKAKRTPVAAPPPLMSQKENCISELSFKERCLSSKAKKQQQEIAVDASLSNWLGSSIVGTPERSPSQGSNSVISHEDRPILGALTVDEIKQFSASNSPRKSPSKSPDEMPIIGTVGTYWNHSASSFKGIPNTTSKYREDKRVNWHSTPFETRLERALNGDAAADASTHVPSIF